jgi:hypothetical protein
MNPAPRRPADSIDRLRRALQAERRIRRDAQRDLRRVTRSLEHLLHQLERTKP